MTLNEAIEICQARIDLDRSMRDGNEDNYNDYEKLGKSLFGNGEVNSRM